MHRMLGVRDLDFLALRVEQLDPRTPVLATPANRGASRRSRPGVERPVTSSICFATVTPSSTFSNFTVPPHSVMIGRVSGSHVASCASRP